MKIALFLLVCFWAVSAQTVYDKCVEECIASGKDPASCRSEYCDPSDTGQPVMPGQGNPLQLFSYILSGPAPVIDGSLMSRDGNVGVSDDKSEWKTACSRTLLLDDSGVVQLFLVNTADTLYVGITYEHGNNSDGSGIIVYFEEGAGSPPGALDGPSDSRLFDPSGLSNEQACGVTKDGGSILVRDMSFGGSAWSNDADSAIDYRAARAYFASDLKVHHTEMAIPLNNSKTDDAGSSDLDVSPDDAIGFYLNVIKMGSGAGTWSWIETNRNVNKPDTFPFWGRIQLSVKREFFTFYTGKSDAPVVDGAISEAAWSGAYQRDLILSNFHYGTLPAHVWCMEDTAQEFIYVGVRVYDGQQQAGDYCQIYFEETGENTTAAVRDFDLDNDAENSLRVTGDNTFTDYCWNIDQGLWVADNEAADQQAAAAGAHTGYVDYEFKVARNGGAYDIDIPGNGLLGFLIRYHDADRTTNERGEFFWEFTTNNDAQLLDQQTKPYVYIATGWANLQLGGPSIQITAPSLGQVLDGQVPVSCVIKNETPTLVEGYISTDTTHKITLSSAGGGSYTGTINVDAAPTGPAFFVLRVTVAGGQVYERVVEVSIRVISIEDAGTGLPQKFSLAQNAPNPFGGATVIRFTVPARASQSRVRLAVYGPDGRLVRTLFNGPAAAGAYEARFNGLTDRGEPLPAGVYFCRMTGPRFSATKKMLLLEK